MLFVALHKSVIGTKRRFVAVPIFARDAGQCPLPETIDPNGT
jgi:hypothetical protein